MKLSEYYKKRCIEGIPASVLLEALKGTAFDDKDYVLSELNAEIMIYKSDNNNYNNKVIRCISNYYEPDEKFELTKAQLTRKCYYTQKAYGIEGKVIANTCKYCHAKCLQDLLART